MRPAHETMAVRRIWPELVPDDRTRPIALTDDHTLIVLCTTDKVATQLEAKSSRLADGLTSRLRKSGYYVVRIRALVGDEAAFVLSQLIIDLQQQVGDLG